jgi:hypothetical protein
MYINDKIKWIENTNKIKIRRKANKKQIKEKGNSNNILSSSGIQKRSFNFKSKANIIKYSIN